MNFNGVCVRFCETYWRPGDTLEHHTIYDHTKPTPTILLTTSWLHTLSQATLFHKPTSKFMS